MRLVHVVASVVLLGLAPSAIAAESAQSSASRSEAERPRRGLLFPPFKKRSAEPPAAPPPAQVKASGPDPDAPAAESAAGSVRTEARVTADGVWEWVDRMEGEVPTPEQVEGIEEKTEEQLAERGLVDDLSGAPVPLALYEDPVKALEHDPLFLDQVDPGEFDIPIEVNDAVVKWMTYFTGSGRQYYERWLARAGRYQPMMRAQLKEAGLPQDLVYLSMIESGYNPHAYSRSDAAGLWQFIPSTGKLYDLRIDWWVDDRRDPERSLEAAIEFLGELHDVFGDWRLAWASYNGGPGRVKKSIDKAGTRDFWTIASGSWLHPETQNYVPKIMAAAIIGKHPERYGFVDIDPQEPLAYDVARVDGSVELAVLAKCAGTSLDELKSLNPALRRYATPPEGYDLRVPVGRKTTFLAALDKVPASERITVVRHTVKRGETLSIIAGRYGSTVDDISKANQLKNINRIYVGMNLVIPRDGQEGDPKVLAAAEASAAKAASAKSTAAKSTAAKEPAAAKEPVAAKEPAAAKEPVATKEPVAAKEPASPAADAAREAATASADEKVAQAGADAAAQGPKVVVASMDLSAAKPAEPKASEGAARAAPAREPAAPPAPKHAVHTVARGESLSILATRYGTTVAELKASNNLKTSTIQIGQKLKVPAPAEPDPKFHVVSRGETFMAIARKYQLDPGELQKWNGLEDPSRIEAGAKLCVSGPSPDLVQWTTYTVRAGDSLSKIAVRNGCTVDEIKTWNGLASSVIQPGQKLKIQGG